MKTTKERVSEAMAAADGMRMNRPAMRRVFEIHRWIREKRFPNCSTLAREFEVTAKTIQRDITFMRDQLQLPLEYDEQIHGYYYSGDVSDFPVFQLSAEDLTALFLARVALETVRGTRLADEMARVFSRIATMAEGELSFQWPDLDEAFSRKAPRIDAKHARNFGQLAEALLGRREVSFRYRKLGAPTSELRRLQPYHLGEVDGGWYVIGNDLDRGALRTFALPRISALKVTRATFERPASFDGKRHLLRSFGIWTSPADEPLRLVRVELRDYAAGIVQERRWHPSQEVIPLNTAGTRVEVRFEVGRMEEVVRWVLGWGCKAKVLEPADLRAAVRKEAALISRDC